MDYFSDKSKGGASGDYIMLNGSGFEEYDPVYLGETYTEIWSKDSGVIASITYDISSVPDDDGDYGLFGTYNN